MKTSRIISRRLCLLALAFVMTPILPAHAVTRTWDGSAGDWTNAAKWGGTVPGNGEDAVIPSGTVTLTNSTALIGSFTNSGALIFAGTNTILYATNVTVNGTITHNVQSATDTNAAGEWVMDNRVYISCSNLTVAAGGKIDADLKGYAGSMSGDAPGRHDGRGPGLGCGGAAGAIYRSGGGYGGVGGNQHDTYSLTYGSLNAPVDPGSGGGSYDSFESGGADQAGTAGGGLVRIEALGKVIINGTITANSTNSFSYGCGGQAAQSILRVRPSKARAGSARMAATRSAQGTGALPPEAAAASLFITIRPPSRA